jgi:nicotinamide phosphoribosyltransferase
MKMNPFLMTDAYKISHPEQYPEGTEYVYSNITPRGSRIEGVNEVVVFGTQYFIKEYLINTFNENFFSRDKEEVIAELDAFFAEYFGPGSVDTQRHADLHDLGYLPLSIKALPEGTKCPMGVPYATIINTDPKFGWLTNFIETLSQTVIWNPLTSATIANRYRKLLDSFAEETGGPAEFVPFQGHNFSMRGMSSFESGYTTDGGHLLSFVGSDTLSGNVFVKEYYNANPEDGMISCSVPATEHAVMCAGGEDDERETFRRLIQDIYPSGIVSIVSDTWNLWDVLLDIAPSLKDEIEARDGKVVFRPDSGDPVKIVCGYNYVLSNRNSEDFLEYINHRTGHEYYFGETYDAVKTIDGKYFDSRGRELTENEIKGCIQILWEQFGGTTNHMGYKELNPKVGLIYGDSITFERCERICQELKNKGFASTNVVFGIGSFTYQYNTRDTFSIACKATWVQINGVPKNIFKDPITDNGMKKSACGLLRVDKKGGSLVLSQEVTPEEEKGGELVEVFRDGKLLVDHTLKEIRERLDSTLVVC